MSKFQTFKYLSVFLIGICISFVVFYNMNQKALLTKQEAVNNAISRSLIKIEDEINKINLVMESMNFFFENHEDVSQELFERFTDPYLMELRNIGALEWAPRIDTVAKNETTEDIPDITTTDTEGNFVTVDSKSVHYPIVLLNPLEPLKDALGFDNYSETTRKTAIDLAISSNQTTITAPVQLVQKNNGLPGFLAIKAVKNPKTKETKGIVAAIYRMDIFINRTLKNELPLMHMALTDSAAQSSPLFSNFKDSSQTIVNKKSIIKSVKASNRVWNVHFLPKRDYFAYPHVPESYIILLLGILTTGLILYTIKKNDEYHDRLEARVQIRTSELEASNKMKENLLREIHHRVKNNLQITSSLMNMQKRKLVSKEAITALSDSQARISAIALTHQKIYQDKDSKAVNLHDYLVDLMEYQKKISPSFTYKIDCPYVSVDLDRAVPLALIISELVTNAVKHAYPDTTKYNELSIDVSRIDEENVFLSIRDNGKGLPEGFELEQAEGIGFEIIRALCRQITATLTYASTEEGTQFDLKFKNLS